MIFPTQTELEYAPMVSRHETPQVSPQEYDCGCVTAVFVTAVFATKGARPFEMRVAHYCDSQNCELKRLFYADDTRSLAVALVDNWYGHTMEFSAGPEMHRRDYDEAETYLKEHRDRNAA